jgi:hypothetical protein
MIKWSLCAAALCAAATYPALADQWSKSFNTGAKPQLHVVTNDGNVTLRASSIPGIQARVVTSGWKIGPDDVRITENQNGDRVELEVKVPSLHFNFGNRWVKIELDVPTATTADVHTGDGNIRADGLRGKTRLVTHDGNIEGESFDGELEASSGDGNFAPPVLDLGVRSRVCIAGAPREVATGVPDDSAWLESTRLYVQMSKSRRRSSSKYPQTL